ncbi:MAG: carbohydrate ABC transporter permease [Acetivibrionales bacterium]
MGLKSRIHSSVVEIIMWLFTVIVFIPYLLVVLTSVKTSKEAGLFQLNLPSEIHIVENYRMVFEKGYVFQGFLNSLIITGLSAAIILFSSSLLSFYIARVKTRVSTFLYIYFTMGMTTPISLVTTFQLLKKLGILNTRLGVIMIFCSILIPFASFIYVGFIKSIPVEMDEAAIIDGCGPYRLFTQIVLPLLKPATFTCAVLVFMNVWNDAQVVLFFLNKSENWTMPLNIYRFFSYFRTDWNYVFGSVFLTTLPVFIIYLFGQRYIIQGMVSGAVKG